MDRRPAVYIMTNKPGGTLYVGVTSDLPRRVWQHREGETGGFTATYRLHRLAWFEQHEHMLEAIRREKAIKTWPRRRKVDLVLAVNPGWVDLYPSLL